MANLTLNNVIANFQAIADAHKKIESFGFGDVWEINTSGDINYPLMWVVPENSEIRDSSELLNFSFIFCDIVKNDESNENEVLSDQLEIAKDVIAQLNYHGYDWTLVKNFTLEDFTERFTDLVTGYTCRVSIEIPFNYNRCQIPTTNVSITSGASASSGSGSAAGTIYIYVNGVLDQTIISSDLNAEILNITP